MPGPSRVRTMTGVGAHAVLVSGGFNGFTDQSRQCLALPKCMPMCLRYGRQADWPLAGDIVDAKVKRDVLMSAANIRKIDLCASLAVGDGANDLPMIKAAVSGNGLGAGYHPRPQLAEAANFAVRHNDLTALLFAQGIRREDWAY